jgi:hypothetical protein
MNTRVAVVASTIWTPSPPGSARVRQRRSGASSGDVVNHAFEHLAAKWQQTRNIGAIRDT